MAKTILVTDSLFLNQVDHADQLERFSRAGIEVERLDKPCATEEELRSAIKGKHGYILGGVETVTKGIIDSADCLEAICFTGSGYSEFIPSHEDATKRGIAITAARGANAQAVAEFTLTLILTMIRGLAQLTTPKERGGTSFYIARELESQTVGIVGMGQIGQRVAKLCRALGMNVVAATHERSSHAPEEGIEFVDLDTLIPMCDILTLHVSKQRGVGVIGPEQLRAMKSGAILINAAFPEAVDCSSLKEHIFSKKIRAAFDRAPEIEMDGAPTGYYVAMNGQTGFNTAESNWRTSERVTTSMINILTKGSDSDVVNPEYRKFKRK